MKCPHCGKSFQPQPTLPGVEPKRAITREAWGLAENLRRQLGVADTEWKRCRWAWAQTLDTALSGSWRGRGDELIRLARWGLDQGYTIDGPRALLNKAHRIKQHIGQRPEQVREELL